MRNLSRLVHFVRAIGMVVTPHLWRRDDQAFHVLWAMTALLLAPAQDSQSLMDPLGSVLCCRYALRRGHVDVDHPS